MNKEMNINYICSICLLNDLWFSWLKLLWKIIPQGSTTVRGKTRALIGGGGEYSNLLVLPDEFLLKSAVIKINFKRISSGRT